MDENIPLSYELHAHTQAQAHAHTHKRTAEINELAEQQRRGIATHTYTCSCIYTRVARINEIAELDVSAVVYLAFSSIEKRFTDGLTDGETLSQMRGCIKTHCGID